MTDVMLIWDKGLLFEKLFTEHGIKCQRIAAETIGVPFLPACKCMIVPTGFAEASYTGSLGGLRKNKAHIEKFVRNGGTVLVFGPMVSGHTFDWLPIDLTYTQQQMSAQVCRSCDGTSCIVEDKDQVECDGYFDAREGKVLLTDAQGRALMVSKDLGAGKIIVTSIHEYPSVEFLRWILQVSKSTKM